VVEKKAGPVKGLAFFMHAGEGPGPLMRTESGGCVADPALISFSFRR